MRNIHTTYVRALLAGVATVALAVPAFAADTKADARDAKLNALEQKLDALVSEISALKKEAAADKADNTALQGQVIDLKRAQAASYADVQAQRAADVKVSIGNGRPTFTSADGNFSLSLRSLLQFDSTYYAQNGRAASGTSGSTLNDLSSGTIFRRARIGVEGKAYDWSYSFIYDLGGSGTEASSVSNAYIQYDGIPWVKIRTGAFPTPEGIEDQTSAGDLIFLERAAPVDLARSIAGSDGRKNYLAFISYGTDYYASAAWSGGKAFDAPVFDTQQALVGRTAYRIYKDLDTNILLSGTGTYIFRLPQTAVGNNSASAINLQVRPENVVDGTRLISTGNIDADKFALWGVEAAANWKSLYGSAKPGPGQWSSRASPPSRPSRATASTERPSFASSRRRASWLSAYPSTSCPPTWACTRQPLNSMVTPRAMSTM